MTIAEYTILCRYHTNDQTSFTILAGSEDQAIEVARHTFRRAYTDKNIFDGASVVQVNEVGDLS